MVEEDRAVGAGIEVNQEITERVVFGILLGTGTGDQGGNGKDEKSNA